MSDYTSVQNQNQTHDHVVVVSDYFKTIKRRNGESYRDYDARVRKVAREDARIIALDNAKKNYYRHVRDADPCKSVQHRNTSLNADFALEERPLGKDANIVAKKRKDATYQRFRELRFGQYLLIDENVKSNRRSNKDKKFNIHKTRTCHSFKHYMADTISVNVTTPNSKVNRASLSGVNTCGCVWACPVCARRVAMQRGLEIGYTIDEMQKMGYVPLMITLTARHTLADRLYGFKEKFKLAWRKFSQGNWKHLKKKLQIKHSIKAVEVTRTYENGWHYHSHGIAFVHADVLKNLAEAELDNWQNKVTKSWLSSLRNEAVGLDGDFEHACHIAVGENVKKDYLAKLGLSDEDTTNVEYELTSGHNKDYKGRNIWSILRSAAEDNEEDAQLYVEYVKAMSGDNWITYSNGLKALVNLDEMSDEQASQKEDEKLQFEKLMDISEYEYSFVRKYKAYPELLELATSSRSEKVVRDWLKGLEKSYYLNQRKQDIRKLEEQKWALEAKLDNFMLSDVKRNNPLYEPMWVLNLKKKLRGVEITLKEIFYAMPKMPVT